MYFDGSYPFSSLNRPHLPCPSTSCPGHFLTNSQSPICPTGVISLENWLSLRQQVSAALRFSARGETSSSPLSSMVNVVCLELVKVLCVLKCNKPLVVSGKHCFSVVIYRSGSYNNISTPSSGLLSELWKEDV